MATYADGYARGFDSAMERVVNAIDAEREALRVALKAHELDKTMPVFAGTTIMTMLDSLRAVAGND